MSDTAYERKVMKACDDGKRIQFRTRGDTVKWRDIIVAPVWDWLHEEYRIKPEPLELWVNLPPEKKRFGDAIYAFLDEEDAKITNGIKPTLFRQVLDSDAE